MANLEEKKMIKTKFIESSLSLCNGLVSVPRKDILLLSEKYNIKIRSEHIDFLMKFGGGNPLFIKEIMYGDFSLNQISIFYEELFKYPSDTPDEGLTFFGGTYNGITYGIDYLTGEIFIFDGGERYENVFGSISDFIFFNAFSSISNTLTATTNSFDTIIELNDYIVNNKIINLADINVRGISYYFNETSFFLSDAERKIIIRYDGGILNKVLKSL